MLVNNLAYKLRVQSYCFFLTYAKKNAPKGDFYMLSTLCALSLTLTT